MTTNLFWSDGELGFIHDGVFVTDPFVSDCGRFLVDPINDYGLTTEQVAQFTAVNKCTAWEEYARWYISVCPRQKVKPIPVDKV